MTARSDLGDGRDEDVEFLDLNGGSVTLDDEAAFRLVMDVAEGRLDVDGIVGILGAALTSTPKP